LEDFQGQGPDGMGASGPLEMTGPEKLYYMFLKIPYCKHRKETHLRWKSY